MTQGRRISECKHKQTISTVTAGLERTVCESCGHVTVRYIEPTVRLFPDMADRRKPAVEPAARNTCATCGSAAEFMIPGGLACAEHAWKEASLQQIMGSEPWIPITIDQRTNAS